MIPIQAVIGSVVSIAFYSLMLYGIYKIFQISTEISEMKDLLRDIKRNTEEIPPAGPARPQSHEDFMRTLADEAARVPDEIIG